MFCSLSDSNSTEWIYSLFYKTDNATTNIVKTF